VTCLMEVRADNEWLNDISHLPKVVLTKERLSEIRFKVNDGLHNK